MACWSTAITCISKLVYEISIDSILLTVLGFVVGLALSFRSSTAYERYLTVALEQWSLLYTSLLYTNTKDQTPDGPMVANTGPSSFKPPGTWPVQSGSTSRNVKMKKARWTFFAKCM